MIWARACLRASIVVLGAACANPKIVMPASRGAKIATIELGWSNVHVVFGERPLLVDSGVRGDLREIADKLADLGVALRDVRCAVITHGHADHAGTARAMQAMGITIIMGAGDRERTRSGEHGAHHATSVFAWLLHFFLPEEYAPFTADVLVTDRYDLAPCGIAGEVVATPGHTAGHVVVVVGGGKIAIVGDLFRGGRLGGFVDKTEPMVHFYQDDKAKAHAEIKKLLARGVEWFVLGHGGPSTRAEVADTFDR
jgi:glyoxylase-like metal-dependent hydrolase (beta-lactamase superfamily II)